MDHHQPATRMVCLWGLVKAYQQIRQSTYVCPPAPHVIEAFNHKVNHDSDKELGTQEHAVLQYARALQYVSYCNNERYRDHIAPVVKALWDEVAQPFGSRALHNLDLLHVVGKVMCPNRAAKIPDYGGVGPHCTDLCPLLQRNREPFSIRDQAALTGGGARMHRCLGQPPQPFPWSQKKNLGVGK